jgi:hypothetical protein
MVADVRETSQSQLEGAGEMAAALPLFFVFAIVLLSPLLYDLLQWLGRSLAGS